MPSTPNLRLTDLKLPLDHDSHALRSAVMSTLQLKDEELLSFAVFRRGFDARRKSDIHFIYTLDLQTTDNAAVLARMRSMPDLTKRLSAAPDMTYRLVAQAERVEDSPSGSRQVRRLATDALPACTGLRPVVIGTGPCGLFAALTLAQMGFCPIILERGKAVRERTKDTWGFWRKSELNPQSNVQFGEGGAGTFSDGKLWSQVKDPQHHGRRVLQEMVKAGAPEEILYVSKPHVGTFRLVKVVEHLRGQIEALGGEFRFSTQVVDVLMEPAPSPVSANLAQHRLTGLVLDGGEVLACEQAVLAIGHSARDTFEMLYARGVYVEAKPFSVGFRIEHPQSVIDRARFGPFAGNDALGAADYKLVHHASNGRSVYSFCMCPGGTVVAATSEVGRVVTNGMSQYSRNERNANAGIVVGIEPDDFDFGPDGEPLVAEHLRGHPLAGMRFQRALESRAYALGGGSYEAPGQLVGDFLAVRPSTALGSVVPSYKPGVYLTALDASLPAYAIAALREAIPAFAKQIAGFDMADAILTGVETRTSAPIRIKRLDARRTGAALAHERPFQSINTHGLYPAGEGAGYAGGIMSAAIDGIKVAEALALAMGSK